MIVVGSGAPARHADRTFCWMLYLPSEAASCNAFGCDPDSWSADASEFAGGVCDTGTRHESPQHPPLIHVCMPMAGRIHRFRAIHAMRIKPIVTKSFILIFPIWSVCKICAHFERRLSRCCDKRGEARRLAGEKEGTRRKSTLRPGSHLLPCTLRCLRRGTSPSSVLSSTWRVSRERPREDRRVHRLCRA